jgi:hypothetical protein
VGWRAFGYPAGAPARSKPRIRASAASISPMVSGVTAPVWRSRRVRDTALIARQIARLGRSMPSPGDTSGRSADDARELDNGTTTINSLASPTLSSSTDMTTAGRFLPGSPVRAAPNATSQTSPRRGSVEAIGEGRLPHLLLGHHGGVFGVREGSPALRAPDRLCFTLAGHLGEQRGKRDATLTCLPGKDIAGSASHSNCCCFGRHGSHSVALSSGAFQEG